MQIQHKRKYALEKNNSNRIFGKDLTNLQMKTIGFNENRKKKNDMKINLQLSRKHSQVSDYIQEINEYARKNASKWSIDANYMEWHKEINYSMRQILIGWLISTQHKFQLNLKTLFLAIHLIDKFCYNRNIEKVNYQLLGGTALFIAAKFQEIETPRMEKYVRISDKAYNQMQLLQMEAEIMLTLDFNLQNISSLWFLDSYLNQIDHSNKIHDLCSYLLYLSLLEFQFCTLKPNFLSCVIVEVANKLYNFKMINYENLRLKSGMCKKIQKQYNMKVIELYNGRFNRKFNNVNKIFEKLFSKNGELIII